MPPSALFESRCYTQCSEHGRCMNGACHCNEGYGGADCSVVLSQPPSVLWIKGDRHHGMCDARNEDCQLVSLIGDNLLNSNALSCHYAITELVNGNWSETTVDNLHQTETIFMSFREVHCQLSEPIVTIAHSEEKGTTFATVMVYVSNDMGTTLSNGMVLTTYDSRCILCNGNGMCRMKKNTCQINGHCYSSGQYHPSDYTMQCVPGTSQDSWTVEDDTPIDLVIGLSVGAMILVVALVIGVAWFCKNPRNIK
ncbi:von Willebrand factor D and EGF domain-containing protein-like [Saccoglossus kowalevskii]|uniref:Uncharacterized protein LOC102803810 n=1 Tax=Saccoglossus kowalevskii TaxID=10224 RepID=A0ABM0MDC1_SACKO|nr:PREDICTED: uncharacterized protein LOC102803810 [Saccoglossus kowalevskii]